MLPRRQLRDAFYNAYSGLTQFVTKDKGRIPRYQEQDLPAINITTYSDRVEESFDVHGGQTKVGYAQSVVIEIYQKVKDNFEDDIDALEEAVWPAIAAVDIPGVRIYYEGSELTPVKDAEVPQAVRLLTFTARYAVDQQFPDVILS